MSAPPGSPRQGIGGGGKGGASSSSPGSVGKGGANFNDRNKIGLSQFPGLNGSPSQAMQGAMNAANTATMPARGSFMAPAAPDLNFQTGGGFQMQPMMPSPRPMVNFGQVQPINNPVFPSGNNLPAVLMQMPQGFGGI